jgi:hypothetical protein
VNAWDRYCAGDDGGTNSGLSGGKGYMSTLKARRVDFRGNPLTRPRPGDTQGAPRHPDEGWKHFLHAPADARGAELPADDDYRSRFISG